MVGKLLQSLEPRAWRRVDSPLPAEALNAPWPGENLPPGWRPQRYALGPFWSSLDREMALQFSRIAPAAAQTSGFCHLGNASVQVSDRGLDRRYSNAVA